MLLTINECRSKNARTSVLDCHLLSVRLIMAMERSVSNDLRSTFVDSINIFNCPLSGVFIEHTEYVAKTIRNKG